MKALFDLFPVLIFFAAFKMYDIYAATAALMAASLAQVVLGRIIYRHVARAHLVTLILVTLFGGATLALGNEAFIQWKPSVLYWLFGAGFIASHFLFGGRTLAERMMGAQLTLPPRIWRRINAGWALLFIALGLANLYVARHFDTDTWVDFKLFGLTGATLAFALLQALYVARHLRADGAGRG